MKKRKKVYFQKKKHIKKKPVEKKRKANKVHLLPNGTH